MNKCNCCGKQWDGKKWVGDHEVGCPAYFEDEQEGEILPEGLREGFLSRFLNSIFSLLVKGLFEVNNFAKENPNKNSNMSKLYTI